MTCDGGRGWLADGRVEAVVGGWVGGGDRAMLATRKVEERHASTVAAMFVGLADPGKVWRHFKVT